MLGFRSTFAAKKEWKWSVTFSLLARLRCTKSEGHDWLQVERGSIIKVDHMEISFKLTANLSKAFEGWKFVGSKFLTIELSLKDIKKSPMESFPSKSAIGVWLRICLFESIDRIILSTEPGSLRYQIVSVSWLSSKKNITLCLAMTVRPVLQPKYWILHQLLRYSC